MLLMNKKWLSSFNYFQVSGANNCLVRICIRFSSYTRNWFSIFYYFFWSHAVDLISITSRSFDVYSIYVYTFLWIFFWKFSYLCFLSTMSIVSKNSNFSEHSQCFLKNETSNGIVKGKKWKMMIGNLSLCFQTSLKVREVSWTKLALLI